jgi:hypothetical protein
MHNIRRTNNATNLRNYNSFRYWNKKQKAKVANIIYVTTMQKVATEY